MKRALLLLLTLAACTDHRAPITGAQALQVTLNSPTDPGSADNRLPDAARSVSMTITAIGPDGKIDTTFDHTLQVYVQFLGTLSPYFICTPGETNSPSTPCGTSLTTVQMSGGMGTLSNFTLPPVFGPTTVWFEDGCYLDGGSGKSNACPETTTYATGSSPTLWYRDPFIQDIRKPANESSPDAYEVGPVDNKNVAVAASRYGATGKLVITSVYSQGYTLADVNCKGAGGTPPCTASDYDYIDVFSYSAALDQEKRFLNEGQVVDGFAGGVSEFDGLLEIGFPQTFFNQDSPAVCSPPSATCNKAFEPQPDPMSATCVSDPAACTGPIMKLDQSWFTNTIYFKRNESNALEVDNAAVCNLDSDYATFKQWKLDLSGTGGNCTGNLINVVSAGIFDPTPYVGKKLPKVIGVERSINIGTFHVWIIYPRAMSDITTQ